MNAVTYALANVGRGSDGADQQALRDLHDAMPQERAVVLLCEINEGDRNDELALARRIFDGWHFYCKATREPIALSPDWPKARSRVLWVDDSAVQRWSPRRSVNLVHLPGLNETVIGGHPAAGGYHGDRPAWAKPLLKTSWDNFHAKHRHVEKRLHARGRNVTWLIDYNNPEMGPVVEGEQTVFHDVTDIGRVLPAQGQRAVFEYVRSVDFHVDSHDGHVMRGKYVPG